MQSIRDRYIKCNSTYRAERCCYSDGGSTSTGSMQHGRSSRCKPLLLSVGCRHADGVHLEASPETTGSQCECGCCYTTSSISRPGKGKEKEVNRRPRLLDRGPVSWMLCVLTRWYSCQTSDHALVACAQTGNAAALSLCHSQNAAQMCTHACRVNVQSNRRSASCAVRGMSRCCLTTREGGGTGMVITSLLHRIRTLQAVARRLARSGCAVGRREMFWWTDARLRR